MLPDRWYPILESSALRKHPVGVRRLGVDWALWRDGAGQPVALPNACPHRGASLSDGRVIDGQLACPWHGFRFAADGACMLMPCEGADAKAPRALSLETPVLREEVGLIWMWHGEQVDSLPDVAFFDELRDANLRATAQASYVLPYHYSRMVETNLDIHHTPFVHGATIPVGTRVEPFEAKREGDLIRTHGELRKPSKDSGFAFRADCLLPCLVRIGLGEKLEIVVSATPVDENHTWLWFRYYQNYTRIAPIGKAITWISVVSELKIVQPQDWRIFAGLTKGTIDDVDFHFVAADQGIALYRRARREALDAARSRPALSSPVEGEFAAQPERRAG